MFSYLRVWVNRIDDEHRDCNTSESRGKVLERSQIFLKALDKNNGSVLDCSGRLIDSCSGVYVMMLTKSGSHPTQLSMPGMPEPSHRHKVLSCCNVVPGQEVVYMGNIQGGPRYGTHGIVKQALQRKAVVDMGKSGTWTIPYYFLSVSQFQAA
jgi:hypothetical protein